MPRRVLYIDDDRGLTRLVERHLRRRGFEVLACGDAGTGLASIAAGGIDVVALDHYMPGEDGLAALERICALPDPPPVVYVTGAQDSRIAVAALKQGATDYVAKDVSGEFLDLLGAALESAMEAVRLRRERTAAQAELTQALQRAEELAAQRAVLLEEINHRVANSLQLIASILQLQAGGSSDAAARQALSEACDRVHAVAAVHRRLHEVSTGSNGTVDTFLRELVADLARAQERAAITFAAEGAPFQLELQQTVALGVTVCELVANALKYAYPDGEGAIRVRLARTGDAASLAVEDDGIGISPGVTKGSGLGSRIIQGMARSLGATVDTVSGFQGTAVRLSFPVQQPSSAGPG